MRAEPRQRIALDEPGVNVVQLVRDSNSSASGTLPLKTRLSSGFVRSPTTSGPAPAVIVARIVHLEFPLRCRHPPMPPAKKEPVVVLLLATGWSGPRMTRRCCALLGCASRSRKRNAFSLDRVPRSSRRGRCAPASSNAPALRLCGSYRRVKVTGQIHRAWKQAVSASTAHAASAPGNEVDTS